MIYLDNASTSFPKPKEVAAAVTKAIDSIGSPYRGFGDESISAAGMLYELREEISDLFNVGNGQNVAFIPNATYGLNAVISGLLSAGDHVISTVLEHNSVLRPLYRINSLTPVSFINCDALGNLCYEDFKSSLRKDTKAVICTHASNVTGNVSDIGYIGNFCRENGLIFILDAAQTAGYLDIDMDRDCIDILVFSGHKALYGPQGTGAVCVSSKKPFSIKPFAIGGSGYNSFSKTHPEDFPSCLEAGTLNAHSLVGLMSGVGYIKRVGMKKIYQKTEALAARFYEGVRNIRGIKLYGDYNAAVRCPIVTLNLGEVGSDKLCFRLHEEYRISTRAGAHCAPLLHKAFKTEKQGAVRFGFSHFNTCDEVDIAIKAIENLNGVF